MSGRIEVVAAKVDTEAFRASEHIKNRGRR